MLAAFSSEWRRAHTRGCRRALGAEFALMQVQRKRVGSDQA